MSFTDSTRPIPAGLATDELVLRPISVDDAERDHAALMETREQLRRWQLSTWPEDDFTVEANRRDLRDLEERHAARRAFTYTVLGPDGTSCLGCVYVFPTSATFLARSTVVPLGEDAWSDVEAVVFFWVRQSGMERGLDERLLAALRTWFREEWRFGRTVFVTSAAFTQQVGLLQRTDLRLAFELDDPEAPGRRLAFA